MKLEQLGFDSHFAGHFAPYETQKLSAGRVSLEHKNSYIIYTECGEMPATVSGRMHYDALDQLGYPVVGDWVVANILDEEPQRAIIHAILPRKSKFSRKEAGKRTIEQPIAANIDTVFIVVGLDHNFRVRRIERYLTLAWESGANPAVILTKSDLSDAVEDRLREVQASAPGVPVHAISVLEEKGLNQLSDYLTEGKTIALLGSSGVGKSTIVNYLIGKDVQSVQEVREEDSRGRHTTTRRQMFVLPSGGLVIDTPGMRELQLWDADEGLSGVFEDIENLARECRFTDCSHENEPGCKVRQALESGELDPARFENYRKMLKELNYLEKRQDVAAALIEREKWKKIHKQARGLNKGK
ncbi:MAG: ribosome small subunit-dependent GTPase A [Armatimonadota bacterium]